MIEESKEDNAADAGAAPPESTEAAAPQFHSADTWQDGGDALTGEPLADECTIDDFMKVDLRVARIVEAGHVEGADRLLQLTLSSGGRHHAKTCSPASRRLTIRKLWSDDW